MKQGLLELMLLRRIARALESIDRTVKMQVEPVPVRKRTKFAEVFTPSTEEMNDRWEEEQMR